MSCFLIVPALAEHLSKSASSKDIYPLDRTNRELVMMQKLSVSAHSDAHLSSYRLPDLTFGKTKLPYDSIVPVWSALASAQNELARTFAMERLSENVKKTDQERAALKVGLAWAQFRLGALDLAKREAGRSLDLCPNQFSAHRILLNILSLRKGFAAAYLQLLNLPLPKRTPRWDETLASDEVELALASWAWQLGEWDQVFYHLNRSFPDGLENMPDGIREDWFRLALYRGHPEDAAAAAALLIDRSPIENTDQLLQTIVKSGWTKQALPLYRTAYAARPESELLRRRLVGLCIREGQLDEARALTNSGALRTAA